MDYFISSNVTELEDIIDHIDPISLIANQKEGSYKRWRINSNITTKESTFKLRFGDLDKEDKDEENDHFHKNLDFQE